MQGGIKLRLECLTSFTVNYSGMSCSKIKRPKKEKSYTNEDLVQALSDIKSGNLSAREASVKYKIPRSTLGDKITGRHLSCIKGMINFSLCL